MQFKEGEGVADFSRSIREAVQEAIFSLWFGALLATLTVFVFLRRFRPTLVVGLAIPVSLVATFGFMWVFDYTLNTMTLLALTLAVGVVIDDAIVVLENIERHREAGLNVARGGLQGHARDRLRRHGRDRVGGRGVRARRVRDRHGRQLPRRVRRHRRHRGAALAGRGAHAHADARRAHPAAEGAGAPQHLPPSSIAGSTRSRPTTSACSNGRLATSRRHAGHRRP